MFIIPKKLIERMGVLCLQISETEDDILIVIRRSGEEYLANDIQELVEIVEALEQR